MQNVQWMTAKEVLRANAAKWPNKVGSKDLYREFTFREWNERACRLANALADMGMKKGDRVAALAYNCAEWMDLYAAAAKGGVIIVPIMFRLSAPEMEYNINHSGFKVTKQVVFVKDEERPRTGNGKILHRVLRETYGKWKDHQ